MRNVFRFTAACFTATMLIVLPACGDDDDEPSDSGSETTEATSTTTGSDTTESASDTTGSTADSGTFPSEAFCDAADDFAAAQDGAQRNTAIGEMQQEAADAPAEITEALETLLTGDLEPDAYTSASQTIEDACSQ